MCTQTLTRKTMNEIQSIGIREFRQNIHKYTSTQTSPFIVTSHGEALGYYVPMQLNPEKKDFEALKKASKALNQLLAQHNLTEDEIIDEFKQSRKKKK